jgi:23S rRNA (uracil1939-C5)-methyltransferase
MVGFVAEAGDAAAATRALAAAGEKFDVVIVNPPRRGLSPETRHALGSLGAPRIAYVSCDPDTLARDLDHLARLGYQARSLLPFDMIPLTEEVETLAVLGRASPPLPRVVWEDDEVLIVEKAAHEPTTPQGEHASSLLERARRIPGAEGAVPVHRLDLGTSGLLVLARRPEHAGAWAAALAAETGRKIYLAAVKGITPAKGAVARALREEGRVQAARTRYRRLAVVSGHSLLRVLPDEGRTHQIRRHLAGIGHPVLGDARYGHSPTNRYFEERNSLDRTFLHCVRLELSHPRTGERLVVQAPLPGDLRATLVRLGGAEALRELEQRNSLGGGSGPQAPPG